MSISSRYRASRRYTAASTQSNRFIRTGESTLTTRPLTLCRLHRNQQTLQT